MLEIEVNELQLIGAFIPDYSGLLEDPHGEGCIDRIDSFLQTLCF